MKFRILLFATIDSTNDYALSLAKEGIVEGTVVISDYQTKGRGRYKRTWVSPSGKNLLFSIVMRPLCRVNKVPLITHVTARAVKETLETIAGITSTLKKPNDVLIKGRKVCGILTEIHSRAQTIDYCVIGVGINVNSVRKQLVRGATSLFEETGIDYSKEKILTVFLKKFAHHYKLFFGHETMRIHPKGKRK
ncbi:MAG: biotin--[acetyl-CoA-carboxylase] ligase [Candidatus Omnitrophica bacterium]|nr:biotin--[acetyl-CoA-carboxylase] ligase [Candidatus Omnitrophota bacterium]